jgi:hypothetical protein
MYMNAFSPTLEETKDGDKGASGSGWVGADAVEGGVEGIAIPQWSPPCRTVQESGVGDHDSQYPEYP